MDAPSMIALSRQMVLQRRMDVIANNLANSNTTGFKAEAPLVAQRNVPVFGKPQNVNPLAMVIDNGTMRDTSAGTITQTGNDLDVALQSDGYFVVNDGTTNKYTRAGSFQMNADGDLIDHNGFKVQGDGGPITIPPDAQKVTIAQDGTVATEKGQIGKLAVVKFDNDQALTPSGGGLFATDQAPTQSENVKVTQGSLESSNVNSITQMTDMIDVLRQYQSVQNLINTEQDREKGSIARIARLN